MKRNIFAGGVRIVKNRRAAFSSPRSQFFTIRTDPKRVLRRRVAEQNRVENDPSLADRSTLTPAQIADLLNFTLRSTYFQYNRSIYEQQEEGAAMESPVSAVIANLYVERQQLLHHTNLGSRNARCTTPSPSQIVEAWTASYSILTTKNLQPASPWRQRLTTSSPSLTTQFLQHQTDAYAH